MTKKALVALDQGTTSSRAIVFDLEGRMLAVCNEEFPQIYPQPGWVEHDPKQILRTQISALQRAVRRSGLHPEEIAAIGITNQRETTLLWKRDTGECVANAIVWQCRRTAEQVEALVAAGHGEEITKRTGLIPDAYFSGTKLKWLLDKHGLREKAASGELCFGTVDSFLAWHLVSGHPHVIDATNASRTMLFNLREQRWDDELLKMLDIPAACLPQVVDSCGVIGTLDPEILGVPVPVAAMAGDQHASLFGQACFTPGSVKNTHGTGCFMLMNTGSQPAQKQGGMLSTMAWRLGGKASYATEGSVFIGGAVIQWLRDELKLIKNAAESEEIATSVEDTGGVFLVPAFTGLGAPWWDMYARGLMVGLTRGTGRAQIVRAALESIAFQSADLLATMAENCGFLPKELKVDGGASANGFLMQFEADIMGIPVVRPRIMETTAFGAALMAGIGVGIYASPEETARFWQRDLTFEPQMSQTKREELMGRWHEAVRRSLKWAEDT
ncbi:MAG: glycerol kinase GlpK [Clostridia bacterium]|nr:glycerol kinase GlpK [Clostridia bacterium]